VHEEKLSLSLFRLLNLKNLGLFLSKEHVAATDPSTHWHAVWATATALCLVLFLAIMGQPLHAHWSKLATGSGELLEQEVKRRMAEPRKEVGKIDSFKKKLARR